MGRFRSNDNGTAIPYILIVSAGFLSIWCVLSIQAIVHQHDFLNFYHGASLAIQRRFVELHGQVPSTAQVVFVRPVWYAVLLAPLGLLPYEVAFCVWMGLQALLMCVSIVWACRRFGLQALLFGTMYAPAMLAIPFGQDAPALLAIVTLAYRLAEKERPFAGFVLGLGLIKFHLFLLWPVLLLITRRFRMLAWLGVSCAVQTGICALFAGPGELNRYVALLMRKDLSRLSQSPEKQVNLQAMLLNAGLDWRALFLILAAVVVIAACAASVKASLWRLFALATAGSLLIAPHVYGYDAALLLLPAWCGIFLSRSSVTRIAASILCLPVPFFAGQTATFGLLIVAFFAACAISRDKIVKEPEIETSRLPDVAP